MRIFDEDAKLDNAESNRYANSDDQREGTGLRFSSDFNMFRKTHNGELLRDQSMEPYTSYVKSIRPWSLIFNSVLLKSKMNFYNESSAVSLRYKKEEPVKAQSTL